jgi:cysteine-rich repeat protein
LTILDCAGRWVVLSVAGLVALGCADGGKAGPPSKGRVSHPSDESKGGQNADSGGALGDAGADAMTADTDGAVADASVAKCGDHVISAELGEDCDDGNTVTEPCMYGEASCRVCGASCQLVAGVTSTCGDGTIDSANGEQCDSKTAPATSCSYGETSCKVCNAQCQNAAGTPSYCGDGSVDAADGEQCDDGNAVTEGCAYGATSCSVCDSSCHNGAGTTSFCGDGTTDGANGEQCDGGATPSSACAYGSMSCMLCNGTCQSVAGTPSYCGDGVIDTQHGEQCDDLNTANGDGCDASCHVESVASCGNGAIDASSGETCDDHNTNNLDGCSAACRIENGWTCPTLGARCVETCGDGLVVGDEVCDDTNSVDDDYCSNDCRTKRSCGDGAVQASAGEQCDDHNTQTEACSYGETSCTVCNASCRNAAGVTSYCGDGVVQSGNGEECEPASDIRCSNACKIQCDTIYITYSTTGNVQLTGTFSTLGDGTFPQTGGTLVVAFATGANGPVAGAGGVTYMRFPISFMQTILVTTTVATDIVGTSSSCTGASPGTCVPAADASNRCPLTGGSLVLNAASGSFPNIASPLACPYGANHGTNNWTPDDQQVSAAQGPGCLEYSSQGTIMCNGVLCAAAGLTSGSTMNVNDQWDQTGAALEFSADFKTMRSRAVGLNNGTGNPDDKFEVPERVVARTWLNFDGTETSRSCEMKPSNCHAPGAY